MENNIMAFQCPFCTNPVPQESLKLIRGVSGKLFLSYFCRLCFTPTKRVVSPAVLDRLSSRGIIEPSSERPSFLRRLLRRSAKAEAAEVESKTNGSTRRRGRRSKAAQKEMEAYLERFQQDLESRMRLCLTIENEERLRYRLETIRLMSN